MKNTFTTFLLCNSEPYLQFFNYKLLHTFVAHETLLFNFGIHYSLLCKTCKEIDRIDHIVYLCDSTNTFFERFVKLMK